jgi:Short C-terminal domain
MGLIKTGLKAAVAVKVGHAVHDRIQRRQQAEWAAGGHPAAHAVPPAAAPAPAAYAAAPPPAAHAVPPPAPAASPPVDDVLAQLTKLGELRAAGVLTEDEFLLQKARILGG